MNLTGIVLAGGKSSRLGFNKIEIKIGPVPLFINQIFKLALFCDEILIISSEGNLGILSKEFKLLEKYHAYFNNFIEKIKLPAVSLLIDDIKIKSGLTLTKPCPLLGIYTGLKNSKNFYSFVVGSDMPFISYNLLSNIIKIKDSQKCSQDKCKDIISINTLKGFEALCSIYSKNCIAIIKKNLKAEKYKIIDIFSELDTKIITQKELEMLKIDDLNFFNINTVKDLEKFKNLWAIDNSEDSFASKWKEFFYR
ncbi:MAG: molybdenum cofactor guanylyltransferase [Actinobacteria bacterium]|nr:molybdenum cofactor guanylyltransferase [Actinomycetota bacterium]